MNDIFYQDNNDRQYYCMDFSSNNVTAPGDIISGTPTVSAEIRGGFESDLVIEDVSVSGLYVCMWVSSGTPHSTYKIEVIADTANGTRVEGDGFIRIGD